MTIKSALKSRLESIRTLEGILPTAAPTGAGARRELSTVAIELRAKNVDAATREMEVLTASDTGGPFMVAPALDVLSGSSDLRHQTAAFAEAGIGFFHATAEYAAMSATRRAAMGGNGTVSRVMLDGTRLLLETPRVVVRFTRTSKETERKAIMARHRVVDIGGAGLPAGIHRVACEGKPALDTAMDLMSEKAVSYAEPDFVEHIGARYTPKDPLFAKQWHHRNIGAEAAWDVTTGAGLRVAVIDNGFDTKHRDLTFGPLSGWFRATPDFSDADFVPGTASMPDRNHGTACAGMIGAKEGNARGGCGVAYGASINMIACLGDQVGTQSTLARAVAFAASPKLEGINGQDGADIIVCSLGPNGASWTIRQVLSDAIDFAVTKGRKGRGTAIFWACTNGNFPISADQICSHPRVIAVGRSTSADLDNGSGFGPELAFLAPGVDVHIPASGDTYQPTTGTSFAAPCAAGIATLALARRPTLDPAQLRAHLEATCDKIGPLPYIQGRNTRFGHGRLNAARAVA